MSDYSDIIDLPHYEPARHRRMPTENRAAQFGPFAALTGFEEVTRETARRTGERAELEGNLGVAGDGSFRDGSCPSGTVPQEPSQTGLEPSLRNRPRRA